jgi:NADPH:quinone reductase-like Zn-dependent oxidoreductase
VTAGRYRVNVDRTFALAQANEAWELAKQQHTHGKLIITMPNQ